MTKQEFEQFTIEMEASGMSLKTFMTERGLPLHQYLLEEEVQFDQASNQTNRFIQIETGQPSNSTIRLEYPNGVSLNFQSNPGSKALLKLSNSKH